MDDERIYGKEFYRTNFSYAMEHQLLTDYKVLVLMVSKKDLFASALQDVKDGSKTEVTTNYDALVVWLAL